MTAETPTPTPEARSALALHKTGHLDEAAEAYREEIRGAESGRHAVPVENLLSNLAAVEADLERWEEAERAARRAMEEAERAQNLPIAAAALRTLGRVHRERGEYDEARACFRGSGGILLEIGDDSRLSSIHAGFAAIRERMGETEAAREHWRRTLDAAREEGNERRVREATARLGHLPSGELPVRAVWDAAGVRRLLEINRALLSERSLKPLLRRIMDHAVELTGAERGFVLLSASAAADAGEGGKKAFQIAAARNFDQEDIRRARVKVSRSIAETVLYRGEPVICTDAAEEEPFRSAESVVEMQLRSILCVPLREDKDVIGAIYLDNRLKEGAFHDAHLRLLEAFADQAALAVTNARLHEQNEARRVEIEELNVKLRERVADQQTELDRIQTRLEAAEPSPVRFRYEAIVGRSEALRRLLVTIDKVVENDLPVLVQGESGTGKELVARAIHFNGARRNRPFAAENCAALNENLLESELFGHVRGAFTGAHKDRRGLFEVADGGTLFLDEIGDMGPGMQAKLLRVLETGEIRPVGATQAKRVNVRILSATNRDLRAMVGEKAFREDLFYRLNTVTLRVPPLRERREDVPLLVDHFLERLADKTGQTKLAIDPDIVAEIARRDWPGNVRELENEVFRLSVMARDGRIGIEALAESRAAGGGAAGAGGLVLPGGGTLTERIEAAEREMVRRAIEEHRGNRTHAAKSLGISRNALLRKISKYGLG